jgi:uncharacterized protein YhfF
MAPTPSIKEVIAKLRRMGLTLPPGRVRVDRYGDSEELSNELLSLIRSGRKRAGTALAWSYEHEREPIPYVGDIEIVVDYRGDPSIITRIVRLDVIPYSEVTAEYTAVEGEGDGSLEYWRSVHWPYFARECGRVGRDPSESMPVVCSVFEILAVLPRAVA